MSRDSRQMPSVPGGEPVGSDAFMRHAGRSLLVAMYAALRSLKLYPVENATVQKSLDDLQTAAQAILGPLSELEVRLSTDFVFVNGTRLRLELDNYTSFSNLMTALRSVDVGEIRVHQAVQRLEWQIFLGSLLALMGKGSGEKDAEVLLQFRERLAAARVTHIEVAPPVESEDRLAEAEKAREAAKRTYSHGVAVTKDLISSVRMGRTTSVAKVKRAVQAIVDQVLNNETSLLGLTTIRDYDEYTFAHSVNVCILSIAIGRKLGLSRLQLYDLGLAGLLHDVGKARIPAEITNKDSGLNEEEWRLMQTHPWLGVLTLFSLRGYEEIPYRQIVVAHEHHMKVDLTGYPKAIRPREIGIYSRIVAVADGYDAATTRRSYQTVPIEPDQVLREMWENPRRGYDRILVKAMINLIGVYPIGTCVILDTFEVAVVSAPATDPNAMNRPVVRLCRDANGAPMGPPGPEVNLAEQDRPGHYRRSIVKVTNPDRYGIIVGDYFL